MDHGFTDDDIKDLFFEEIESKERVIRRLDAGYPHDDYDYSTDDTNDYEYQQDRY